MVEGTGKVLAQKLLELTNKTGYPILQHNGQRKYGPPQEWNGPAPPKGCEVFIGKLPREVYEDELVPIFSSVGKLYEMRLMMDFSGSNRGYAFVTYTNRSDAIKAVKQLNGYEIRTNRFIGVVKSVDNCRLFIGGIPKTKTKQEVLLELAKRVSGIVDVILYQNCFDRRLNRGFAFVEFTTHRAAAMARRALIPGCVMLWDQEVMVDWAEPEPEIDDEQMSQVKVLYARNFKVKSSIEMIQSIFESAIRGKVERVKKINDYAFIHFYTREDAALALSKLQGSDIDGSAIELRWAKPVDRELYRIQKRSRGNAKFNNSLDFSHTLSLYKQHLNKREYANSRRDDEGIGSAGAGSICSGSPDSRGTPFHSPPKDTYTLAPAKLDAMCKRYNWLSPIYKYQQFGDSRGGEAWVAVIDLPMVAAPLLPAPRHVGPLITRACHSMQQAKVEAAECALNYIKALRANHMIDRSPTLTAATPMIYPPLISRMNPMPYSDFTLPIYQRTPLPINPTIWRTV